MLKKIKKIKRRVIIINSIVTAFVILMWIIGLINVSLQTILLFIIQRTLYLQLLTLIIFALICSGLEFIYREK